MEEILWFFGIIIVPDNMIGLITKKFVLWGVHKNLPQGKILALHGEAGDQVDTLASGVHYGLWPWQYSVKNEGLTIIPEDSIKLAPPLIRRWIFQSPFGEVY